MRRTATWLLTGLVTLSATPAAAAPPAATDFSVRYFLTDKDGDKSRLFTVQDMQQLVNKARCECGQEIITEITLTGNSVDQVQLETFMGSECETAQILPTGQDRPCARLNVGFPDNFKTRQSFSTHPLWLRTGVAFESTTQDVDMAIAGASCESGQGQGGVWMCALGADTDCQQGDFFMTGTTNTNIPADQETQGITFDFSPPISVPNEVDAIPGDGAVVIKWNLDTPGDINGYRILCANMDDSPVDGKGIDGPGITDENNGTVYYTKQTLCPDGAFNPSPPIGQGGGGGGTTGGGTTGGGTTGGTTSGTGGGTGGTSGTTGTNTGIVDDWGGGVANTHTSSSSGTGGSDTSTSGGGTGGSDTSTTSGGTSTGTGGGSGTGTGGGTGGGSGIESLDYAYVCSGHLANTTNKARVQGLQNGTTYKFLLVAYDLAGNPVAVSPVMEAAPEATNDLWDECQDEAFAGVCSERGFCNCRAEESSPRDGLLAIFGVGLLGWVRRRRPA